MAGLWSLFHSCVRSHVPYVLFRGVVLLWTFLHPSPPKEESDLLPYLLRHDRAVWVQVCCAAGPGACPAIGVPSGVALSFLFFSFLNTLFFLTVFFFVHSSRPCSL